jgi:hypothetical protein
MHFADKVMVAGTSSTVLEILSAGRAKMCKLSSSICYISSQANFWSLHSATAEVSEVIGKFPGVAEANVYGVKLPNHEGRAGCAALQITPEARQTFDFAALARFAQSKLPRYAVPVFLRVVENSTHIHNHKQNKVPLRDEGADPSLRGTKVADGGDDNFLWLAPGEKEYSPFGKEEWDRISNGQARL